MASKLCIKDFTLVIDPDPTFQGLTWEVVGVSMQGSGAYTYSADKHQFSMHGYALVDTPGADLAAFTLQVTGGSIVIPSHPQTRNCILHVQSSGSGNQGPPNTYIVGSLGVPPTTFTPALGWEYGVFNTDVPFIINAGGTDAQRTLSLAMRQYDSIVGGVPSDWTWTGYLYVQSYS